MILSASPGDYGTMKLPRWIIRVLYPAYMAGVALVSLVPVNSMSPSGIEHLDKIGHGLAYAAGGVLGAIFLRGFGRGRASAAVFSLALGFALGAALELLQPLAGRSREAADGLANLAGLLAGAGAFLAASRTRPGRKPGYADA